MRYTVHRLEGTKISKIHYPLAEGYKKFSEACIAALKLPEKWNIIVFDKETKLYKTI